LEEAVVQVRQAHGTWGGRKIARRLRDLGLGEVAPSTVTGILHRHGLISAEASEAAAPWQRFEHEQPNALWQIDFKGDFPTLRGPCVALTLLDDHSRFNLTLTACTHKGLSTVQPLLQQVFRRYGMPVRINADNGAPWGSPSGVHHGLSQLSVWLIRNGIRVSHSTPYHPQTNGKLERFHKTLEQEVLAKRAFTDAADVQQAFDDWRASYNTERPHDSLGLDTPAKRYQPSVLRYREALPPIEYAEADTVLRTNARGEIRFHGRLVKTSEALAGLPVAVRPDPSHDGYFDLFFCHQRFMRLDLNDLCAQT
jgi:transposase InsO family protein